MPDRKQLKIGDHIRLLCVPRADIEQREDEIRRSAEMAGWTADTIERIIAQDPVVTISKIDEWGAIWFDYELTAVDGGPEYHSLTIIDDESWCYA